MGKRDMDQSEQTAREFLEMQGFKEIKYEPDGNVPPDFLLDRHIAVEVRRLNQNVPINTNKGFKSLQEDSIPLSQKMYGLLNSIRYVNYNNSWYVSFSFKRPLPDWSKLEQIIRNKLETFDVKQSETNIKISVTKNFTLKLYHTEEKHDNRFVFGGYGDRDSGGWVLAELEKNLNLCIAEKWKKIALMREKYIEWWLLLLDQINYGFSDVLEDGLKEMEITRAGWNRIILIDPTDPLRFCEI